jgi:hypothetical protein
MEGQKEFRRRISRIQTNKSHTSDDNKFTRIQKKVKALLQAREAIQKMKKLTSRRMSTEVRRTSFDSNQTSVESAVEVLKSGPSTKKKLYNVTEHPPPLQRRGSTLSITSSKNSTMAKKST